MRFPSISPTDFNSEQFRRMAQFTSCSHLEGHSIASDRCDMFGRYVILGDDLPRKIRCIYSS